jgi:hypothetical protein
MVVVYDSFGSVYISLIIDAGVVYHAASPVTAGTLGA